MTTEVDDAVRRAARIILGTERPSTRELTQLFSDELEIAAKKNAADDDALREISRAAKQVQAWCEEEAKCRDIKLE